MQEGTTRRTGRRDSGDGAVFQRGDGRWVARLKNPNAPGWRYFYAKTKAGAKERLRVAARAVEDGRPIPNEKQTFGAYLELWLDGLVSSNAKPATIAYYRRYVGYHLLKSPLAAKPLGRIEAGDLRQLYAAKLAAGLSSTTVHHLHAVAHRALGQAVDDGKLAVNPASRISRQYRPRIAHREMTTIADGDQPRRFIAAAAGERLEALLVLAITTGMRQGELRALRWKDVDLERRRVAVTGSVAGIRRADMAIGTPKNGKARSVTLSATAEEALHEHRTRQKAERLLVGPEWSDRDLVFCTAFGDFLPTNTMVLLLQRVLRRASLPKIRFHDLRHTAATLMLSNGVHPKIASEMLGHSSVAITLDLYSHVSANMQQQAAQTMDRVLVTPASAR